MQACAGEHPSLLCDEQTHATKRYSTDRQRISRQMGGWFGKFHPPRAFAATLPLRRMPRGGGCDGSCPSRPGTNTRSVGLCPHPNCKRRRLCHPTHLGGRSCHRYLFLRLPAACWECIVRSGNGAHRVRAASNLALCTMHFPQALPPNETKSSRSRSSNQVVTSSRFGPAAVCNF